MTVASIGAAIDLCMCLARICQKLRTFDRRRLWFGLLRLQHRPPGTGVLAALSGLQVFADPMHQFRCIEIEQIGDRNGTIRCIAEPHSGVSCRQRPASAVHVHHAQGRLHGTEVTRVCISFVYGTGLVSVRIRKSSICAMTR